MTVNVVDLPLGNGFYLAESLPVSSQLCTNMYPNYPETQGISQAQLYPSPGIIELTTTGPQPEEANRGAYEFSGNAYFVNGNRLYFIDATGNQTDLGLISGSGRVSIADNGTQMCIVVPSTGIGYIYTETGGLVQITDPNFTANGNAEIVVFVDGYFVFTTASKRFFISNLNNGLVYDALDFGSAEADPDIIRSAHVHKNQLYIFGSQTIEVFQNVGGAGFPFQRISGFVIPKGITSPFSVAEFDNTFCFIGQGANETPRIYAFTGSGVQEISHTAIESLLQQSTTLEDTFVFTYSFRGARFIGWSGQGGTIIYDSKASALGGKKVWHQRTSSNVEGSTRWRISSLITAYDKLLVGDSVDGRIGVLESDVYTEYGNNINRVFRTITLENNSMPAYFGYFEVIAETGLGLPDNTDPLIGMTYSDDAKNYISTRYRSAGKQGEYSRKIRWQQLGRTNRWRIFEISMSDPIRWVINKVTMEIQS